MKNQVFKGRYTIQNELTKNAGRRTFIARDLQTQNLVVIKLLILGEDFQWDDLKLFEREAQTLKLLSHPAIPRYLDYFDIDTSMGKGFALVQSYIPAQSLEQCLKAGRRFSEEDVKQLAQVLLEILRYLHEQQPPVIHRDIKPSNILLTNRSGNSVGQIYLVDFGSVQTLAAKKGSTITVVGTYGYMPPEQFGGRTVPASDLYSLGATLIYLVTGKHPAELPQDNLRIQFESGVNLSSELIDWLKWMTQPSLNRRLASAVEALTALEHPDQRTDISVVKQKPFGSRIQLEKSGENTDVFIPPPKRLTSRIPNTIIMPNNYSIYLSYLTLILAISLFLYFCVFKNMPLNVFVQTIWFPVVMFLFIIHSIFYGFVLYQKIFRVIRVHLEQQKIYWTYEWFWLKLQTDPILKKDIKQLIYNPGYFQTNKPGRKSYTAFIPPKITIVAQEKHEFPVYHLSDPEMEWLAHELSEWLGMPITKG
jgi:serine/threonine protein kinase